MHAPRPTFQPRRHAVGLLLPLALAACSTAPMPPKADEAARRPANPPLVIELQSCRNELHNTRLMASESTRLAEATTAALHQLTLAQGAALGSRADPRSAAAQPGTASASTVYTFGFDNNSTQLAVAEEAKQPLLTDARQAALIVIRGRTDATTDAPMNAKAARERAEAARDLLMTAGIDARRIRLTWQAFGDPVADNSTPEGKALNRRVEIELYRQAPTIVATAVRPTTTAGSAQPATAGGAPKDIQAATSRPAPSTP